MKLFRWFGVAAACLFVPTTALANPEPPAVYDARAVALGGAVGPLVDGPTALFHNPAGLAHIYKFELNFSFTPMIFDLEAPLAGAGTEANTGWSMAPLSFFGAAGRVHERITIGAGLYVPMGYAADYDSATRLGDCSLPVDEQQTCRDLAAPTDQKMMMMIGEAAIPVGINVLDNLRLGVSLRLPYGVQQLDSSAMFNGEYTHAVMDVSGIGTPGVLLGVQWDAHEQVSLSFAYRSKVKIHMDGNLDFSEALGPLFYEIPVETDWDMPHMLRAGLAWRPLEDRLRIVAEGRVQLHKEANEKQVFEADFFGGQTIVVPLNWRNVWLISLGAEYEVTDSVPVRLGFSWGNSATPHSTATPLMPPPDLAPAVYAGSGYHAKTWRLDAAIGYTGGVATEIASPGTNCSDPTLLSPSGCDGSYSMKSFFAGLSFEYTMGGRDYVLGGRAEPEPVVEPAPEPVVEPAPEPAVEPAPEPVVGAEPPPSDFGVDVDAETELDAGGTETELETDLEAAPDPAPDSTVAPAP